jgi:hypothetical protein
VQHFGKSIDIVYQGKVVHTYVWNVVGAERTSKPVLESADENVPRAKRCKQTNKQMTAFFFGYVFFVVTLPPIARATGWVTHC